MISMTIEGSKTTSYLTNLGQIYETEPRNEAKAIPEKCMCLRLVKKARMITECNNLNNNDFQVINSQPQE